MVKKTVKETVLEKVTMLVDKLTEQYLKLTGRVEQHDSDQAQLVDKLASLEARLIQVENNISSLVNPYRPNGAPWPPLLPGYQPNPIPWPGLPGNPFPVLPPSPVCPDPYSPSYPPNTWGSATCSKCGMVWSGVMGYVCPTLGCPMQAQVTCDNKITLGNTSSSVGDGLSVSVTWTGTAIGDTVQTGDYPTKY